MIEPTPELREEMRDAMVFALFDYSTGGDDRTREDAALDAVLRLLARESCMEARGHVYHPLARAREWPSGRGGKHPHYCVSCSDGEAAGPGCGNCRSTGFDQTPWPDCGRCPP